MDLKPILDVEMKIARSPRELEQLRNTIRMNLYLEVKTAIERESAGKFNKAESARTAVELVNRLCGEESAGGAAALTPPMSEAVEAALARIRSGESDIRIAASFMRWSKAAGLLMRLKNDEAEVELREAVELNPKSAFALCSLAYLSGFRGEAESATDLAKKALEIDPALPEAWVELGNAYEASGEHNLAKAAWQKAESLNPHVVRSAPEAESLGLPGRDRPETYDVLTDEPEP